MNHARAVAAASITRAPGMAIALGEDMNETSSRGALPARAPSKIGRS
jgi:hypothetical protein